MKKLNLLYTVVFLLAGTAMFFSQTVDRLYLSIAETGSIYDITGIPATFPGAVPGAPAYTGTNTNLVSNLAVGYDTPGGNPSGLVYLHSNTAPGSLVYKSTVSTGQTIPSPTGNNVGGIGTNNVPVTAGGNPSGESYGFSATTKNLYRVYPNAADLGLVTGDAIWSATTSTIWATDTFFDYQNFIYVIVQNVVNGVGTRYLYKVNPSTLVATLVTAIAKATTNPAAANPVGVYNNTPSVSTATTVGGIRGLAYLNGQIYAVSVNGDPGTELSVYRINITTGTSTFVRTYTGFTNLRTTNQDLATVPYYIPFAFNCAGITQTFTVPFVRGVASTNQKFLNIPINSVYADGTYTINIVGTDFTSSTDVNITTATTSIQIPLNYTGSGAAGVRTLQVNLSGSTTSCFVNVVVDEDTDRDTIGNSQDLDSDNDGILDIFECADTVVSTAYSSTDGTVTNFSAPAADLGFIFDVYTLDNSFNLNINGVNISTATLEFQPDQGENVRFLDGATYGAGAVPQIYSMTGSATAPLVRIIIHKNGAVNMYGSKSGGGALFPLQLYNGNAFNNIIWNQTGANTVQLSQPVVGATYITGRAQGFKNGFCDPDNDTVSNQFDVDSDGDGCPDSIEGSENVKFDQVHSLTLPSGDPNFAYRGQIKTLANGIATGTPFQVVSKLANASGVPELVNYAQVNTSANAGVADNTDGTSDVGQGIGDSQNAAVNSCICYKPTVTVGTILDTNHGVTSLQRAGANNSNWPMVRKGAWTALESKTKGFVPNRLTTAQIAAIPTGSLIEGMMVYNVSVDCLQINTDGTAAGWKCFNTQTCSDIN